ncbi:MAG: von Willebrand factor type A domain-containing protein [Bacteroidota bacterium]|jgi:Ca-activated chloride channel family protein|nr:von Willebrand factor type A domain-containing protein [Cytophagales bacterium]MCE2957847.1 von Willebrand factor type A domain-containing protein [Flammeovirgaceae bacterium]MCZ8072182.1 von Willebrand factor type A domain-containing protein [Cytophagales bacterium]
MKTRQWILVLVMAILASPLAAQTRNIFGKVTAKDDGSPLPGVNVILKRSTKATVTDAQGNYTLTIPAREGILVFSFVGMKSLEVNIGSSNRIDAQMEADLTQLNEVVVVGYGAQERESVSRAESKRVGKSKGNRTADYILQAPAAYYQPQPEYNTEEYDGINENIFHGALQNPLSTFSIDVDAASYSNIRRFIQLGQRPPKDAVRIEEMVNYFDYDYKQPTGEDPFSIYTEIAAAPWNKKHKLVHIGLQGKNIPKENLPASNLVFLIDVSGSMSDENKLPLLKASFKLLVEQLREQDRVAIVVYAGAAGLVLPSTSGAEKKKIIESLENLQAGGSTAGGEGIKLAYKIAKENFRKDGNNRVILATDGDFNVGESSNAAMERLVEEKRNDGIFLTTLGFGMGNYKDSKMEILADKGNGNYMYIDSILEAQKALVNEFGGTLFTIAKDVKLQIEFNPAKVKAYRLIGYENRMLKNEDFNNDKKDAGELGSGHTVTALYEIVPVGVESEFYKIDELKYQTTKVNPASQASNEIMTVKFRYKKPDGEVSKLIVHPLVDQQVEFEKTSDDFRWSAAVAAFGMILRESEFVRDFKVGDVEALAKSARGIDKDGYRAEFINLLKTSHALAMR